MKIAPKTFLEGPLGARRYAFILDEANHFNSKNRSNTPASCLYSPAHENTEGCAIGRWLPPDLQRKLDITGNVLDLRAFNSLPEWMIDLGRDFLYECQVLHDTLNCWCETGLSVDGERKFNEIVNKYVNKYAKRTIQTT